MQWKSHQQDGHRTKTTRNAEKPQNFDADAAGAAAGRQTGCPIYTSTYTLYRGSKAPALRYTVIVCDWNGCLRTVSIGSKRISGITNPV